MPRRLLSETTTTKTYEVTDAQGKVIGQDIESIPTAEQVVERTIRIRAGQAFAANKTFLALTSPTNAQVGAQVKSLTRQVNGLLRITLADFTDSNDT